MGRGRVGRSEHPYLIWEDVIWEGRTGFVANGADEDDVDVTGACSKEREPLFSRVKERLSR